MGAPRGGPGPSPWPSFSLGESGGATAEPPLSWPWPLGAAVAAGVMGFPLFVRSVRLSIEAIDTKLETAARTLGASAWKTFWTVSLPLMAPGILAGLLLAFARALSEFGATITFVANIPGQTRTLPIAIYSVLQAPGGDTAALRMVVLSTALAIIALATSEFMARRLRARLYGQS